MTAWYERGDYTQAPVVVAVMHLAEARIERPQAAQGPDRWYDETAALFGHTIAFGIDSLADLLERVDAADTYAATDVLRTYLDVTVINDPDGLLEMRAEEWRADAMHAAQLIAASLTAARSAA